MGIIGCAPPRIGSSELVDEPGSAILLARLEKRRARAGGGRRWCLLVLGDGDAGELPLVGGVLFGLTKQPDRPAAARRLAPEPDDFCAVDEERCLLTAGRDL